MRGISGREWSLCQTAGVRPGKPPDHESEPAFELVIVVAVEDVVLAVVLVVQHRIGGGQPRFEHCPLGAALAACPIRVAAPAEIGLREIGFVVPDPLVDHRLQSGPVGAGLRAEDPIAGPPVGLLRRNAVVLRARTGRPRRARQAD